MLGGPGELGLGRLLDGRLVLESGKPLQLVALAVAGAVMSITDHSTRAGSRPSVEHTASVAER